MTSELVQREENAPARKDEPLSILQVIAMVASNPAADIDKLERLLAMQERLEEKQAKTAYSDAMSRLQPKLPQIEKHGRREVNGVLHNKFAKAEDIDTVIRPLLASEGFSLSFDSNPSKETPGSTEFVGTCSHRNGHSETRRITLPPDKGGSKNNIQEIVSSFSYAQKSLVKMLLNIVARDEDKDGELPGFIDERETDQLFDLCAQCDGFKPPEEKIGTEAQILHKYKIKTLGDLQKKKYAEVVGTLMDRHALLRGGGPWKGGRP
jgi:hypothetical protein